MNPLTGHRQFSFNGGDPRRRYKKTTYQLHLSSNLSTSYRGIEALYIKPKNEVFARHVLATTKQENGQSVDQFIQKLHSLAIDCNFLSVSAEKHRDEAIRDAFITGAISNSIRQRLLEKYNLDLQHASEDARMLEHAQQQSQI
ncbi:unnamed protein product [Echinostoma caproni]|uniref:Retrotrans_gag domain-containing protein n=1 Tax=Echinostoma caproni TaxID=27848 RepID=A0A183B8U1_9TREM|nr:unnamed protein product [Echinostoma caproni]